MRTAVVVFTRDLRVRDNPALVGALRAAERVVPLFVLDPAIDGGRNRPRFLAESLADLRESLRQRGGDLVIRRGDPIDEIMGMVRAVGAEGVAIAGDVSAYARRREERLRGACEESRVSLRVTPGLTVVPAGELRPGGGGPAYQVFTPYWRVWRPADWRPAAPTPRRVTLPPGVSTGDLPAARGGSPSVVTGGETEGRRRLRAWLGRLPGYGDGHDALAEEGTSRLSPYLRFGCVSPLDVARAVLASGAPTAEDFVRQLCWRDFYYQVTAAHPTIRTRPVRAVREEWRTDADALDAWREGRTGVPVIDAGMRQLRAEGWMHNRARLLVGSFLTKHLGLDWRDGARWFADWLLDGDVPNNYGNWQWVAGTGNDTKPYRQFNPIRQAHRFDPEGEYVRRYVPELSSVETGAVHEPWRLARRPSYPPPLEGIRPQTWLPDV